MAARFSDELLRHNCNIGSGNGLLPDGTKPLLEPTGYQDSNPCQSTCPIETGIRFHISSLISIAVKKWSEQCIEKHLLSDTWGPFHNQLMSSYIKSYKNKNKCVTHMWKVVILSSPNFALKQWQLSWCTKLDPDCSTGINIRVKWIFKRFQFELIKDW